MKSISIYEINANNANNEKNQSGTTLEKRNYLTNNARLIDRQIYGNEKVDRIH